MLRSLPPPPPPPAQVNIAITPNFASPLSIGANATFIGTTFVDWDHNGVIDGADFTYGNATVRPQTTLRFNESRCSTDSCDSRPSAVCIIQ